ncbi:MAG: Rieske 2Fe-2S domain-containing protein [Myxococcales bacterium]|nr:Rieske 2Fe-2S domain-containing protein [Myxococcales bacterium]
MSWFSDGLLYLGRRPHRRAESALKGPDWAQANPARIDRALERALALPSGGWYVACASREVTGKPIAVDVDGVRYVVWRGESGVHAAPESCPHMGASLEGARCEGDAIVCPWHGLHLGPEGHGSWQCVPAHDDGVLVWLQPANEDVPKTPAPILAPRPARYIDAVIKVVATCEPQDVIANRLDPWHGVHFHPHSFATLKVTDMTDDVLTLRVAYRVLGRLAVEVDATFHCPEPRTIVMTIVGGDGVGSVVETHATPLGPGRTAIIEATLATSERPGFRLPLALSRFVRPYMKKAAERLWVEDAEYAERRYALRTEPAREEKA